jgi:hypothetical protein
MQLTGTLKIKKEEQVVSDKFRKREFVITDSSSQYPQHISFQLTQDRCNMLDSVQVGQTVTVSFDIDGREWTSPQGEIKYFNTLRAWQVKADSEPVAETLSQPGDQPGSSSLPF